MFVATVDDQPVALKLTDAGLADSHTMTERLRVADMLASEDRLADSSFAVVAPVRLNERLVHPLGGWLVTATRFVDGTRLDSASAQDAGLMGQTLAALHRQLAEIQGFALPPVAPLRTELDKPEQFEIAEPERADWQLLHGDFSDANIIRAPDGLRIIDFDDCGYGPPVYDIANSLYMVLFDAEVHGRSDRYRAFRPAFLDGYRQEQGSAVRTDEIDSMIDRRVDVLERWLGDLSAAPIGIRTASPAWHKTLRNFVNSYRSPGNHPG